MEINFQVSSSTKHLSFLREKIRSLSLSNSTSSKCQVALVEAVDNAIFHAHEEDESKPIDIRIFVDGSNIEIEVKDCGRGFDIDKVLPPKIDQTSGRGILIIKALMDVVKYEKNVLKMRCKNEKP